MWIHLNPKNFLACWEGAVGRVFSLDLFHEELFSSFLVSRLVNNKNIDFLDRELYLHTLKPSGLPSRLDCAFLFKCYEDAFDACNSWNEFDSKNLVQVSILKEEKRFEADSNWIDVLAHENCDGSVLKNIAKNYWNAEVRDDRAITEILWKGIGRIDDQAMRVRCFNNIIKKHPKAFGLLIRIMMTFDAGLSNFAGLVKYRLTSEGDFIPSIQYKDIHCFSQEEIKGYLEKNNCDYNVPEKIYWYEAHFPILELSYKPNIHAQNFLKQIKYI